jgi:hypothetical protein
MESEPYVVLVDFGHASIRKDLIANLSTEKAAQAHGLKGRFLHWSVSAQETLYKGRIDPAAVTRVFKLSVSNYVRSAYQYSQEMVVSEDGIKKLKPYQEWRKEIAKQPFAPYSWGPDLFKIILSQSEEKLSAEKPSVSQPPLEAKSKKEAPGNSQPPLEAKSKKEAPAKKKTSKKVCLTTACICADRSSFVRCCSSETRLCRNSKAHSRTHRQATQNLD